MQIKFKYMEVEGFRSLVDQTKFNLDRPGLNLIKGVNGAGKTTLFEALVWCLYGANLKGTVSAKVSSWKEVRGKNYKGTAVIVVFEVDGDEYSIYRTVKYGVQGDVLEVTKGVEVIDAKDKKDAQAYINTLLGMDFKVFMNSFMFGQRMTRMVEATSADNRKLFEDLFDMDWIQALKEKTMERIKELEGYLGKLEASVLSKSNSLEIRQENIQSAKARLKDAEGDYEDAIHAWTMKKEDYETELTGWKESKRVAEEELAKVPELKPVPTVSGDYAKLNNAINTKEAEIDQLKDDKRTLESEIKLCNTQIDSLDTDGYNTYVSKVTKVENDLLEITSKLIGEPDVTEILTADEKNDIRLDYEQALSKVNSLQDERNKLIQSITDLGKETVCSECGRPFDNAEDIEEHRKQLQDKTRDLEISISNAKEQLDLCRKEAQLLRDFELAETTLKSLKDNPIQDPAVIREELETKIHGYEDEHSSILTAIKAAEEELEKLEDDLEKYDEEVEKSDAIKRENQELEAERGKITADIKNFQSNIDYQQRLLDNLETEKPVSKAPKIQKEIDELDKALEGIEAEIKKLEKEQKDLDRKLKVADFWNRKVFAANGLKAYVFKAMLDELNQYTEKYGAKLGCSIRFSLDLEKASAPFSTICSLGDKVNKEYKEFSGGQKQRLDIVLMFAMHDLLSSSTGINILIMDEVFEGLDDQGESDVFELIREKAEGRAVYVISHSQVLDTLYSKTIEITEENGKTRIS